MRSEPRTANRQKNGGFRKIEDRMEFWSRGLLWEGGAVAPASTC
jgi:hypothetical protein